MEPEINIPVWVRLTDLELYFWHEKMVGKIASMVGTPIGSDFPSLEKRGLDWPRVQVIIDASKPPLKDINLEMRNGDVFKQKLDYEYLPKFCKKCSVFGHYADGCLGPEHRGRQTHRAPGNQPNKERKRSRSGVSKGHRQPSRQPPPSKQPQRSPSRPRSDQGKRFTTPPGTLFNQPLVEWRVKDKCVTAPPNAVDGSSTNRFQALATSDDGPVEGNVKQSPEAVPDQQMVPVTNEEMVTETCVAASSMGNTEQSLAALPDQQMVQTVNEEMVSVEVLVDLNLKNPGAASMEAKLPDDFTQKQSVFTTDCAETEYQSEALPYSNEAELNQEDPSANSSEQRTREEPELEPENDAVVQNLLVALPACANTELFEEATRIPNRKQRRLMEQEKSRLPHASETRVTRSKSNPPAKSRGGLLPTDNNLK